MNLHYHSSRLRRILPEKRLLLLIFGLLLSVGWMIGGATADANDGIAAADADVTSNDGGDAKGEVLVKGEGDATTTKTTPTDTRSQCEQGDDTCKVRIVTVEELATKNGKDGGKEIWLSILGQVYDVSAGPEYYSSGSSYHIFAGRDATVPFITGNFTEEEASKSTDELTAQQLYVVEQEWAQFYAKDERYHFVGYLCCRYYNEEGLPTEETLRVSERVKSYAKIKAAKDKERREKRKQRMQTMTMTDPKTTSR